MSEQDIFEECAQIALEHIGQCAPAKLVGENCGCYDAACRDIAEAIRTRSSNRKTMDALAIRDAMGGVRAASKSCSHINATTWMHRGDDEFMRCPDCGAKWVAAKDGKDRR